MATTYTTNVRLQKPATADRHWDVQLNANADYLDGLAAVGGLVVTTLEMPSASLACRISPGTYVRANGLLAAFAGAGSLTLPASTTSYVWLTDAGVPAAGAAYPAIPYLPLAQVITGPSSISQVNDCRAVYKCVGENTVFVAKAGDTISGVLQVRSPSTGTAVVSFDPINQLVGFFGAPPASQAARVSPLIDNTGGSAGPALTNVGGAYSQASLNSNFASLAATVNAMVTAFKRHGLMSN
jgi:hypothetical protein